MKPVASLVSELGARVLAPGVDLLLFIQSATLQLELGDSWDLQQFFGQGWWNTLRISSLAPASEHADWPDTSAGETIRLVAAVDFDSCRIHPST